MAKDSELTPEEEKILREIQLENLYSQMVARRDYMQLKEDLERRQNQALEEQVRDFVDKFKYSYADRVAKYYGNFQDEGISVFLYSEPHMFLLSKANIIRSGDPFKPDMVDFTNKPFVYSDQSCLNTIIESLFEAGITKAAVFEDIHMFDFEDAIIGPDDVPYTPVEAAAFLNPFTFYRVILEDFKVEELEGRIITLADKADLWKRLYTSH
ncbi:hypothetical protein JXB28_04445 [Candidatus Woesearchaeota archaeon]|nr:hypothetical protein [Candidatus Woesearchaeota archaeon]